MSLRPYPEYRDSGQQWLGEIPSHWKIVPLWTLFKRTKTLGTGSEILLSVYRDYGVVPKESRNDNFNKASEDLSKYQLVGVGDLVINKMKAWQGSVAISELSGIVSPAYFVFKALSYIHSRFAHFLMRSTPYFNRYAAISSGVRPNQWDLDPAQHRATPILLPPPHEQQDIADYLDRETAEIDTFIADQEQLIALLEERRTATITQAVTKGLNPDLPMKFSAVEWMGEVPEGWDVTKIGHHFEVILGKMLDGGKEATVGSQHLPYIRAGNIRDAGLDLTDVNEMPYSRAEAERWNLLSGDLLVVEGGSVGTCIVLSEDMPCWSFQKTVNRIRSRGHASTRYLAYVIRSFRDAEVFDVICNRSTIVHLTAEKLQALRVPLPPEQEAQDIVEYLDRETAEIDAAIADAREAIALSKERRAAMISAAVTGKIDVRGLTTEFTPTQEHSIGVA